MPFIQVNDNASIARNEEFFAPPITIRRLNKSILGNWSYRGIHVLSRSDKEKLRSFYSGFVFN